MFFYGKQLAEDVEDLHLVTSASPARRRKSTINGNTHNPSEAFSTQSFCEAGRRKAAGVSLTRHLKRHVAKIATLLVALLSTVQLAHAIIGGATANRPKGQVQIFISTGGDASPACTGSLISAKWVLTAAHCVRGLNAINVEVLAGSLALGQGESHPVELLFSNPNGLDAALLELTSAVPESVLQPIPYGTGVPPTTSGSQAGATILIQGWGDVDSSGTHPTSLRISTHQLRTYVSSKLFMAPTDPMPGTTAQGDSGAGYLYNEILCGVHSQLLAGLATGPSTDDLAGWIQTTSQVAPAALQPDGTKPCEAPRNKKAADIYNAAGTKVVAAFSMVRSLYNPYRFPNAKLYQLTRDSDKAVRDVLAGLQGGYADAAAQDAFCANTTCIVTKLYDQSPFGNDLTIEQRGSAKNSPDSGAIADALPITVNGNKAYGLSVTAGVGYRNNQTLGVARNVNNPRISAPEGMFMLTSGRNFNGLCCFDFGNAETSNNDVDNGHMDALNFGTFCGFPPCSGSGPWVQADLENGQYMGGGSNPSNPRNKSLTSNFVVALLKNDTQTTFALKGGDGQTGDLVDLYSGPLPSQKGGYAPMSLEGAITLGTGGDNSANGIGSFFEGIMVYGYPTDATERDVVNDIAAAHFGGDSRPTNGEPPTYTGPSDPQGPGPQDGFEAPSDEQAADLMGSKPAMAYFHDTGEIYAAFQANDASHKLFVTSTAYGQPYPTAVNSSGIHIGSAPALAEFRHQMFVAFQADDAGHQLFMTSSKTGSNFPGATAHPDILVGSAPALAEFRHQLFVAFQANDSGHTLHVSASPDGRSFPPAAQVPNVQIGSTPAMAAFRSQLFVAFRADDPSNNVWVASSADGYHFASHRIIGQTMGRDSSPALVVSNNVLYLIYGANSQAHEMLVLSSADGVTWQGPKAYLNDKMGTQGPAATAIPIGLTVGFQSNDARNVLFTSFKHTVGSSYNGPSNTGGAQDGFLSPAVEQTKDLMGSKPAFASYNNKIVVAFQANDDTHDLFTASTTIGTAYPTATSHADIHMGSAPSLTIFDQTLWMGFQADDGSDSLFLTSSADGSSWPAARQISNIKIGGAPALVGFENRLFVAFQADDSTHNLFIASSDNGASWQPGHAIPNVKIGSDPALASFKGRLYVAFRGDDSNNRTWLATSSDGGATFSSQLLQGVMGGQSSPALVTDGSTLYYIYSANDLANEMLVLASSDGAHWDGPHAYTNFQMGATGPGASYYTYSSTDPLSQNQKGITVGSQSNDSRDVLFTTIKPLN